jgi:hydroxymethylbilane synthase
VRNRVIRVGSRRSRLALAQTEEVVKRLANKNPAIRFEVVGITTEGDIQGGLGRRGKDAFVKAIEEKLIEGEIDIAVHSMKDMPLQLPKQLIIASVPEREDPRDALVSRKDLPLKDLPSGAKIGTSSLRRAVQLRNIRPDLSMIEIRGNVETRLEKLGRLGLDGVVLAYSGLKRIGKAEVVTEIFDTDTVLPAAGQGALAVEARRDDVEIIELVRAIDHEASRVSVNAERRFLMEVGGDCNLPAAAYARVVNGEIVINGFLAHDGLEDKVVRGRESGPLDKAEEMAVRLAERLKKGRADHAG